MPNRLERREHNSCRQTARYTQERRTGRAPHVSRRRPPRLSSSPLDRQTSNTCTSIIVARYHAIIKAMQTYLPYNNCYTTRNRKRYLVRVYFLSPGYALPLPVRCNNGHASPSHLSTNMPRPTAHVQPQGCKLMYYCVGVRSRFQLKSMLPPHPTCTQQRT